MSDGSACCSMAHSFVAEQKFWIVFLIQNVVGYCCRLNWRLTNKNVSTEILLLLNHNDQIFRQDCIIKQKTSRFFVWESKKGRERREARKGRKRKEKLASTPLVQRRQTEQTSLQNCRFPFLGLETSFPS